MNKDMINNTTEIENNIDIKENLNDDVTLIGSVIGGRKLKENRDKIKKIATAISKLKNYKKPLNYTETAQCLECIFGLWSEKPLHWYYVAEYYTLKSINSSINDMVKRKQRGGMPLANPGAYFYSILFRYHRPRKNRKRKIFGETRRDKIKREKIEANQINKDSILNTGKNS